MRARIGVADSSKVVEIDIDDADQFKAEVEAALSQDQAISWFTDAKKRVVGVPTGRIAFVEIDAEGPHAVGFSPGG